jgi:hypothetical protein
MNLQARAARRLESVRALIVNDVLASVAPIFEQGLAYNVNRRTH